MDSFSSPFSIRHRTAIFDKKLVVSLPVRLRRRIWYILQEYDEAMAIQPNPFDNWTEQSSILQQMPGRLKKIYDEEDLLAFAGDDKRIPVDLEGFVRAAYPAQVLDVIEIMYHEVREDRTRNFAREINAAMRDEGCPWLLCDGHFFQLDSTFLEREVLARAHELMAANRFEGASQEFLEARSELRAGNAKDAIAKAQNAFESVLKTIENRSDGNASALIRCLRKTGFYDGLPDALANAFGENVLMALPFIGNRLGRHGQGKDVVHVPLSFAKLTVHLAAAQIVFLIERYLELKPEEKREETGVEPGYSAPDDDVPF